MTSPQLVNPQKLRSNRLALGASIAAALLSGYGSRQAFAGSCTGAAGTYTCSGAANNATDVTQALDSGANPLTVTTTAGFGIDTGAGNALTLTTNGSGLSFIDNNASSISGANNGIQAFNNGTGEASITSSGLVMGQGDGIYGRNSLTATNFTITAAAVSGGARGIYARNEGTGATNITSSGLVTGTSGSGITAYGKGSGGLTIDAAAVSGGDNGIIGFNSGSGVTNITSTGAVTGTGAKGDGIRINNQNTATGLTINATTVTGGEDGIDARNYGLGATSITSTGAVTGTGYRGIHALNNSITATDLTIDTAAVSGGRIGINAKNYGTGTTSITSSGTVIGAINEGIMAVITVADLTIDTAAVSGGTHGIHVINIGTGPTSITSNGTVTGGSGAGILNLTNNASTITLNSGAAVSAALGNAITDGTGDTTVTVNSGASVTGSVDLAGGSNSLILNGGTLNVHTGFALTVSGGDVINSTGTINLQNNTVDAAATINGNFTGGGRLLIDANFANDTADTLTITGNVLAGGTQVSVNDISSGPATGADITLVSVGGTTTAGDFALASNVVNGAFDYNNLALVGSDWVLQSVALTGGGGSVFTPFASSFEVLGQSLLTLETLPSFSDRTRNRISGASSGDSGGLDVATWLRVSGGNRDIDSDSSTTSADFDTNHWKAQIGADFTLADNENSRVVVGVNAGYGQADTDVNATAGNSNLDTDSYSVGLSATWYIANDTYVDLQAQKSWYETDLSAGGTGAGNVNGVGGDGYSASLELGRSYALSDTLNITPQAQLVYARVDTDTFTGANAEVVKLSDSKSIKARLGAELAKQFTEDGATHGFILANVIHEFEDETQVNVSGAQLANSVDRWSGELGAGITHAWDAGTTHYELFAAVTAGTSLNNFGDSNSVQGEVGFKASF